MQISIILENNFSQRDYNKAFKLLQKSVTYKNPVKICMLKGSTLTDLVDATEKPGAVCSLVIGYNTRELIKQKIKYGKIKISKTKRR